jgi:hypothetical protein
VCDCRANEMFRPTVFMLAGSAAFAAPDVNGKMMFGVNGDFGTTIVAGTVPSDTSGGIGKNYGFGVKAGYGVSEWGMLWGGVGLLHNEIKLKYDDSIYGVSGTETYKQNYIDIDLAFRFLFNIMYLDAGLYYGIRSGNMKWKDSNFGSTTIEKKYTKNITGLLLTFGFLIPVSDSSAVDVGLKTRWGSNYAVSGGAYKLRPSMLGITAGYVMYF